MNPKTKEPDNVKGLDGSSYTVKSRHIRGKGEQLEEFDLTSIEGDEGASGQKSSIRNKKGCVDFFEHDY